MLCRTFACAALICCSGCVWCAWCFAELPFAAGDLSPRGEFVGVFGRGGRDCKDFIEKDFIAKVTHNKHLYTFQNENCINTFILQLYPPRVCDY